MGKEDDLAKQADNIEAGKEKTDTKNRITWDREIEFMLAVIGYAVGLANVWRFPYLCFEHGGGAFLIPYILMAVFGCLPLFFLELALGQYTKQGAIGGWGITPAMRGIGFGSMMIALFSTISYILVMSWSIFYLVHSFTPGSLPWATCGNDWNTNSCVPILSKTGNSSSLASFRNSTSSVEEFWKRFVLRQSDGIHNMGSLSNWRLGLCFLSAWIMVYACCFKGIKSSGKVVYFTATFPYVILLVLFVRGVTLEGAGDGIVFYLKPNMTKLGQPQVWIDAATQVLYSNGICFSTLFAFGSFNKFNNNCHRQAIILVSTACATSLFAGFVIFSILGHMAFAQGKNLTDVVQSGPGLAFIAYPAGIALLPLPQFWSVAFFVMLILLGIDCEFADLEGFITAFGDVFPRAIFGKYRKEISTGVLCCVCAIIGLPLLTSGGIYVFQLFNYYATTFSLLWLTFFESLTVGWIYGADKFYENVKTMIGSYPTAYFRYSYRYVIPIATMAIFIFYCVQYKPLKLDDNYEYPPWAEVIGWLMALISILSVPVVFIITIWQGKGTFRERVRQGLVPKLGTHLQSRDENFDEKEAMIMHNM